MDLLTIAVIIISLALLVLLYEHIKFLRRYHKLIEDNQRLTRDTDKQLQQILQKGLAESEAVLEQARIRAQEVLAETKIFSTQTQQKFSQYADSLLDQEKANYQEAIAKTKDGILTTVQSISEDMKGKAEMQMQELILRIEEDLKEVRLQSKTNLGEYQKEMYNKVDDSIYEIIQEVVQKVLGKSLSMVEHEKLVMQALQEAKHERFIS